MLILLVTEVNKSMYFVYFQLQAKRLEVKSGCEQAKSKLMEATEQTERLEKELSALEEAEGQADTG